MQWRLLASSFSADLVIAPFVMLPGRWSERETGGEKGRERDRMHVQSTVNATCAANQRGARRWGREGQGGIGGYFQSLQ